MNFARSLRAGEPRRFVLAGALNTLATYLLYLGLVVLMPYPIAYSVSYASGIVLSFVLNSLFVFRRELRWSSFLRYPVVYAAQYALGLAVLSICLAAGHFPQWLASALAVAASVPVTFVLSRWALDVRASKPE